jgi:RHS repeat-associated protein
MRDHRTIPGSSVANWSYYHDGQATAEDEQILTGNLTVTRYGLGARGIDECERQTGTVSGGQHNLTSSTSVWYPVYDGHGNQCGTLSRGLNNTYTLANVRTFDCWGNVRRGATTGDPASRYCGSVGHGQDDESLLVYMRARFYDPASGRFIAEDTGKHDSNWFVYCGQRPNDRQDSTGNDFYDDISILDKWIIALEYCPEFHSVAGAAIQFWLMLFSMDGNPLNKTEKNMMLGEMTNAFFSTSVAPWAAGNPAAQVEAWSVGYSAMLQMTILMLDLT